jgi:hypothetical protein
MIANSIIAQTLFLDLLFGVLTFPALFERLKAPHALFAFRLWFSP